MRVKGCVVMAGGRGSRMGGVAKPLMRVCGEPMISRVVATAIELCGDVVVVYSDASPGVGEICRSTLAVMGRVSCVEGTGSYVEDLNLGLSLAGLPALVLPADTPLIDSSLLEKFVREASRLEPSIVSLARGDGVEVGISLFKKPSGPWGYVRMTDCGVMDVDTWEDLRRAEEACRRGCTEAGLPRE